MVFVTSDFISSGFEAPLRVASRRHDVIAITLADPRENVLADMGLAELEDPESGETYLVDTSSKEIREGYRREIEKFRASLKTLLRSTGIDEIHITTDCDYVEPLVKFFRKRERTMA